MGKTVLVDKELVKFNVLNKDIFYLIICLKLLILHYFQFLRFAHFDSPNYCQIFAVSHLDWPNQNCLSQLVLDHYPDYLLNHSECHWYCH